MPAWANLIAFVAASKIAIGLALYFSGLVEPHSVVPTKVPVWLYAYLACTFGVTGGVLVGTEKRDPRAAWLGGVLLIIGDLFAPLVSTVPSPSLASVSAFRLEPFQAAFMWSFIGVFPSRIESRDQRTVEIIASACAWLGAGLVLINLLPLVVDDASLGWLNELRRLPGQSNLYWPIVLGLVVPTIPALLSRTRRVGEAERRRVQLFTRGLLLGMAPILIEIFLEEAVPGYKAIVRRPLIDPIVAVVMFGALSSVPIVTAYSVLFDRVLDIRVVLRSALQYMLARYTILAVTAVPFAALVLFLFAHREEPLVTLLSGTRPLLLVLAVAAGVIALRLRHSWLDGVDRRYFREPYDAQRVLTRFVVELQAASTDELVERVRSEIGRAIHADVEVFFLNDAQTSLRHTDGTLPALASSSTVVALALNDSAPMEIDLGVPESALHRLPADEKQWLIKTRVRLIVTLQRRGALAGLLVLSEKRSGLGYSAIDRQLVTAIAAAASLALDNLRLRSSPDLPSDAPAARECLECSRLLDPGTARCECGGAVTDIPAPKVLRGVFRLEQRIGAGGMGVVYKAIDINLRREVAVKTLPSVTPEHVERLKKEARSMAAATHANLAIIHGLETWRGVPFLVTEFLAGGTLSTAIKAGGMPIARVIDLGITLTDALDHLHQSGILHCDIKPSNIGYTANGVPKLLDFGLARLVYETHDAATVTIGDDTGPRPISVSASGRVFGTPHYMSPEMTMGKGASPALDLWSLSVVLFEALTGRRPFEGTDAHKIFDRIRSDQRPDLRQALKDCPAQLAALFDRLLAIDPKLRPATARELRTSLEVLRSAPRMS